MLAAILFGASVVGSSAPALAVEVAIDASSQLQLYAVRSPWGAPVLSRQRLIHQLAFDAYGPPPTMSSPGPTWAFHSRLRLDGDYGIDDEERDPARFETFVPGLATSPVDLTYGYFAATGLFRNTTDVAIGRQVTYDELGFWSFDGFKLSFLPGRLFDIGGYVGFEQRGGVPLLTTSRYEADGVFRGDRSGWPRETWPSYLSSTRLAPAFGASVALLAVKGLRLRADYRRVNNRDRVVTLPFADETGRLRTISSTRVSSERVGVGAGFDFAERASVDGAWVYDLYRRTSQSHRAQLTVRPAKTWRMHGGYDYRLPLFDADSIFNWFGAKGTVAVQSGVSYLPFPGFQLGALFGVRWLGVGPKQWLAEGLDTGPETGKSGFSRIDCTYSTNAFVLGASSHYEAGDAGRRVSSDLFHHRYFWNERLRAEVLVSGGHFQHPLLKERGQSSMMYVAGVRLFPGARQELSTEWEHVIAEGPLQRFRIVATATARWP
ncbi:MAG: hypothetical protein QM784_07825 [Polyangiaceae bacterium]